MEPVIHDESASKVTNSIPGEVVKSITRNRNYMNSDVGTTIIENEKGEE